MLTLEANYSKKIGLPGYSSHQYSLTLRTELNDINQAETESARLHQTLQTSVDRELQKVGFLPINGNPKGSVAVQDVWKCSAAQRELILKITEEHKLDKTMVDELAHERFGHGVRQLNKLEASGLIDELLERYAEKKPGRRPLPESFPANFMNEIENWTFESTPTDEGLWLHSQYGGQDAACAFIQHLLEKFNFIPAVAFEWSHDCSKPLTDAFGGGAAYITATEIETFSTNEWLNQMLN
jgi:hypothetical protein